MGLTYAVVLSIWAGEEADRRENFQIGSFVAFNVYMGQSDAGR